MTMWIVEACENKEARDWLLVERTRDEDYARELYEEILARSNWGVRLREERDDSALVERVREADSHKELGDRWESYRQLARARLREEGSRPS